MEFVVALLVFGAAFGLGYWQLRGDRAVSVWVVVGLAAGAAIAGLVLGFLFGPFAVFVIGVVAAAVLIFGYQWFGRRRSGQATKPPAEKTCPECAELVKRDARVCRYCGHRFEEQPDAPEEPVELAAPTVRAEPEPVSAPREPLAVAAQPAVATAIVEAVETTSSASDRPSEPSGDGAQFCARCGSEFEDDARFCGICGAQRP